MASPNPPTKVAPDVFFDLVNEVLALFKRDPLTHPYVSSITVTPKDRVLQILAGPGSGKTEVIIWRVLYELFVLGTASTRLLVTTFTKRAATELEVRVVERSDAFLQLAHSHGITLDDPHVHDLRIGTIHSLCDELLAEFDTAYLEDGTELIDEPEMAVRLARDRYQLGFNTPPKPPRVINRLLARPELISLFRPPWEQAGMWPTRVMEVVSLLGNLIAQHIETWIPRCSAEQKPNGIEVVHGAAGLTADLSKLQERWETYLAKNHILDFTTIQKRFLERQGVLLSHFDHVLVDEFQDSNPIQFAIHTKWLSNQSTRLTVVGDDDQAIYRFRGSDIDCFRGLEPFCVSNNLPYRRESLSINYRSRQQIVTFAGLFKSNTVLNDVSMPKVISYAPKAAPGSDVRLLRGPWSDLCAVVSQEIAALGVGNVTAPGYAGESAAILMFSMSERESREWRSPALALRRAIEGRGIRVYNPRSKTANNPDSPVSMLLGIISYLIDPVSKAPIGKRGLSVEVWASNSDPAKALAAHTEPPSFRINQKHAALQKSFIKADGGGIGAPRGSRIPIVGFADVVRQELAKLKQGDRGRLTLSGFVARLLAFPLFRLSGFTVSLFRQALFTQLLEANIAPTRMTLQSLDQPLEVSRNSAGKFVWPNRYWQLLSIFGGYLETNTLDDLEVEAFQDNAVLMITFHQAKGLEFDHVYVAGMGRDPDFIPALRTRLFSGEPVPYTLDAGEVSTKDQRTRVHGLSDREREVYVALTRAKTSLTLLQDSGDTHFFMQPNAAVETLFSHTSPQGHPSNTNVEVRGGINV